MPNGEPNQLDMLSLCGFLQDGSLVPIICSEQANDCASVAECAPLCLVGLFDSMVSAIDACADPLPWHARDRNWAHAARTPFGGF
jgi:hypothetical protein